jgi:cyclopropane fatty-acyl-phospholipid synthase-like methyltransferase
MFQKYSDANRNGSQSEKSFYVNNDIIFKMYGYHNYEYNKNLEFPIIINNDKQLKQLELLDKIKYDSNSSLLDLGCANGAISICMLFKYYLNNIKLLDHDFEYVNNLNKLIDFDDRLKNKLTTINSNFDECKGKYDYVIVLSLIHWLYSATSNFGCLFEIVEKIKENVGKYLIIEWIDNSDDAIAILHHININKNIHKSSYNKENFLKSLEKNFDEVIFLGNSTKTREMYYCILHNNAQ